MTIGEIREMRLFELVKACATNPKLIEEECVNKALRILDHYEKACKATDKPSLEREGEELITFDQLEGYTFRELVRLVADRDLDIYTKAFDPKNEWEVDRLRVAVAEELEIQIPLGRVQEEGGEDPEEKPYNNEINFGFLMSLSVNSVNAPNRRANLVLIIINSLNLIITQCLKATTMIHIQRLSLSFLTAKIMSQ